MNYELTDYSERELQLMSLAITALMQEHIEDKDRALLRECNVRCLTALQIVRDRQTVTSN